MTMLYSKEIITLLQTELTSSTELEKANAEDSGKTLVECYRQCGISEGLRIAIAKIEGLEKKPGLGSQPAEDATSEPAELPSHDHTMPLINPAPASASCGTHTLNDLAVTERGTLVCFKCSKEFTLKVNPDYAGITHA